MASPSLNEHERVISEDSDALVPLRQNPIPPFVVARVGRFFSDMIAHPWRPARSGV